jgi:hypothetical protein
LKRLKIWSGIVTTTLWVFAIALAYYQVIRSLQDRLRTIFPRFPQIAQQLDVINRQLDEAFNKHDAVALPGA